MPCSASRSSTSAFHAPVCVALAAEPQEAGSPDILFNHATAAAAAGERFLELRLDSLTHPADALPALARFVQGHPELILLATCRTRAGGGAFPGSIQDQLDLLTVAAQAGAQCVDIELETLAAADPARLYALRASLPAARIIASAHDFARTADLHATLDTLRALAAPLTPWLYKVVSTATCLADNLAVLHLLGEVSPHFAVVAIAMGEPGVVSRVLSVRAGAPFTFAAAHGNRGTAPGQVSAQVLREQYRVASLGPATRVYGVAGNPVTHSLSPVLHNAGFQAAAIDAVYLPLHTTSVDDLWALLKNLPLHGLSVTMPWKAAILPRLDAIDPEAAQLGAVNTVVRRSDGSLFGANTDLAAIVDPIAELLGDTPPLQRARALVVGAGGAARAAVFGLRARGVEVSILNRTPSAARRLADESESRVADLAHPGAHDIIINATPFGMVGPLADTLAVPASTLDSARVVFEMVYRPAETPLTRLAHSRAIPVISGLEMFLRQGLRQWELWTGEPAPRQAMRDALRAAATQESMPQSAAIGDVHGTI